MSGPAPKASPPERAVLGIDASGLLAGVALAQHGRLLGEVRCDVRASASERVLPQVDLLLSDFGLKMTDVGRVGVALGPGSFTGLRVALATAKGLAQGLSIPLIGVSSLQARSYALQAGGRAVLVVTAHRRGAVFCGAGRWTGDRFEELLPEASRQVTEAGEWVGEAVRCSGAATGAPLLVTGDATDLLFEQLGDGDRASTQAPLLAVPGLPGSMPGVVAILSELAPREAEVTGVDLEALEPRYLRGSDARRPAGRGGGDS